jgi:hypothetical protein
MSYKSIEDIASISKVSADGNISWTHANHALLLKELHKLLGYMRQDREAKIKEKMAKLETSKESE